MHDGVLPCGYDPIQPAIMNFNAEMIEEAIKKVNGAQELDDDMLDGVAGGLVQPINPGSNDYHYFLDGTVCQHCGCSHGDYKKLTKRMKCLRCDQKMVDRKVYESEVGYDKGHGLL